MAFKLPIKKSSDTTGSEIPLELAAGAFLGVLVADSFDPDQLVGGFKDLYERFEELRERYFSGQLDSHAFGRILTELRYVDVNGGEWMIGATSGRWYHRSRADQAWEPTPPDPSLA
jgi:hypothetical protein